GRREGGRRRVSHRSRVYPRSASYDCPSRPRPTWRSSPTVIAGFDCLEPAIHPFGAFPSIIEGDGPAGHTRGGRTGEGTRGIRNSAIASPYVLCPLPPRQPLAGLGGPPRHRGVVRGRHHVTPRDAGGRRQLLDQLDRDALALGGGIGGLVQPLD